MIIPTTTKTSKPKLFIYKNKKNKFFKVSIDNHEKNLYSHRSYSIHDFLYIYTTTTTIMRQFKMPSYSKSTHKMVKKKNK